MSSSSSKLDPSKLDFRNKIILAPMVKIGTLPFRLLALKYGADIVYCEELIDMKLINAKRIVNDILGTVDFVDEKDGCIVFRTCKEEAGKVVLQIGTCDPERALAVAKKLEHDISGIDINMGCPKHFSISSGVGAALLSQPEKVKAILTTLVNNLTIPVTCKIRVLNTEEATISFCKLIESCGVTALAVHGRQKNERPQHANRNELIKKITKEISIPVIANGGSRNMKARSDILSFLQATESSSVMIARAAEWNCSVFSETGPVDVDQVIKEYLALCVLWDGAFANAKYCVQMMLRERQETPIGRLFLNVQTMTQLCNVWGVNPSRGVEPLLQGPSMKRSRVETYWVPPENETVGVTEFRFVRNHFIDCPLPKTKLHKLCCELSQKLPKYETEQKDKLFHTVCIYNGEKYASSLWEKNKRYAEQSAAMCCLLVLGLSSEKSDDWMPTCENMAQVKRKHSE